MGLTDNKLSAFDRHSTTRRSDSVAAEKTRIVHASCVAHLGQGVLILGRSGAGKSSLALQMMAGGAGLVADDRTILRAEAAGLIASCPESLRGLIEARGIGILHATAHDPVPVTLVVDLDRQESHRLPPERIINLLDRELPLVLGAGSGHLAAGLLQYVKAGRANPKID